MNNNKTPYATLDPNLILNAIECAGYRCNGSLLALNSYENRVYQVGLEDAAPLIVKFYRPQRWTNAAILEEHQFAAELMAHEIPVIAPIADSAGNTLHEYEGFRFALFPRQGGRALELDNVEQLEWIGRFIGRLHAVGARQVFKQRLQLNTQTYGYEPYQFLLKSNFVPIELHQNYATIVETALLIITHIFEYVGAVNYIRLHGDCHAGNVLWSDNGPHIVDLDDCLMGPAIQDIWMLVAGDTEQERHQQLQHILHNYEDFYDFNYREIYLIEALRTLRMIHYSAWLAKRWEDPAFPLNFPWFNSLNYWQEQIHNLNKQIYLLEAVKQNALF